MSDGGIIPEIIVTSIYNKIADIDTITNYSKYMEIVYNLFDNEKEILTRINKITSETLSSIPSSELSEMSSITITKAIMSAAIIAFLSERYTRDCMLQTISQDNTIIRRDYETIEDYLKRKTATNNTPKKRKVREW